MNPAITRRAPKTALAAAVLVALGGLAGCGHHSVSATPPTTAASTSTPSSTTSTTVKAKPKPHPKKRVKKPKQPVTAPLTGLPATTEVADRPAVVVKIDNIQQALPQTGIDQADVVYEELVEGGLTRLAAVFQSHQPSVVGPVRSGRLTDEGIADDLRHPVLAYADTNAIFQPILAAQPVEDVDMDNHPSLFVRNYARPSPHNVYTTIAGLAATDRPQDPPRPLFSYRRSGTPFMGAGAENILSATISFPAATISWRWSARNKLWMRTQNGAPDVATDGNQLSAANVVIQWIPYVTSGLVSGEGPGADGAPIPGGVMVGKGTAWFLSGGRVVKGTWSRSSRTSRTVYKDAAGHVIDLQPGQTWVELPQNGTGVSLTK